MKIADTSFKVAIFSDVILVSNYHGCKEKAKGNKLNTTLFDSKAKIVKPSHLEKLQSYQMGIN